MIDDKPFLEPNIIEPNIYLAELTHWADNKSTEITDGISNHFFYQYVQIYKPSREWYISLTDQTT